MDNLEQYISDMMVAAEIAEYTRQIAAISMSLNPVKEHLFADGTKAAVSFIMKDLEIDREESTVHYNLEGIVAEASENGEVIEGKHFHFDVLISVSFTQTECPEKAHKVN